MKAATLQATLEVLGIQRSYSRPLVSNDNPYSEAIFRTLKYRPTYPEKGFKTLENVREWVNALVRWYNHKHQHSGINFVSPHEQHIGAYVDILHQRTSVYEQAKLKYPERWSKSIRDWQPLQSVVLNPVKSGEENEIVK